MKSRILLVGILLLTVSTGIGAQDHVVIVNKSLEVYKISVKELQKVFLGTRTIWPDGKKVTVVVLEKGEVHESFLKEVVKKKPVQFSLIWKKQIFTGKALSYKVMKNDKEVLAFVRETPGAVGYISQSSLNDTVRKLHVY